MGRNLSYPSHDCLAIVRLRRHYKRDEALLLFMLDTRVRASELCGLSLKNINIVNRKTVALGKGNKLRAVYFGRETGKVLWQYVREEGIE